MRLRDLTEKLVDYQIVDPGKGSAFDAVDTKLINTPAYSARLSAAFSRTPYPFSIYAVHHPHDYKHWVRNQDQYTNVMRPDEIVQKYWPDYRHDPKVITLIMTNNFADNKHPLTPWLVAHRFAHALDSAANTKTRPSRWQAAVDKFERDVADTYRKSGYTLFNVKEAWYEIVAAMTTGSARSKNRETKERLHTGEAQHELLTQFIITGQITLDTTYIDRAGPDLYSEDFAAAMKATITRNIRKLNREAANDLSRAIGQVFVI